MNGRASGDPKLLFPGLAGFYATVSDLWYPLIRVVAGLFLFYHGWGKLMGAGAPIANLARYHIAPSVPLAYYVLMLETVGALCVAAGLFTRFFAACIAVELAVIAWTKLPGGFPPMELFLFWGIVMFAIALRGGGPYSLDRVIGKEL